MKSIPGQFPELEMQCLFFQHLRFSVVIECMYTVQLERTFNYQDTLCIDISLCRQLHYLCHDQAVPQTVKARTTIQFEICHHCNLEAKAWFSQHVLFRYTTVLKYQVTCGCGSDSQFVFLFAQTESFCWFRDNEGTDSLKKREIGS